MGFLDKAKKVAGVENVAGGDFSVGGLGGESGALGKYDVVGQQLDKVNPWLNADKKNKSAKETAETAANDLFSQTAPLNQKLNSADTAYGDSFGTAKDSYLNKAGSLVKTYADKIYDLKNQAESQAKDAKSTYSNSILPGYKDAMGMAKTNAHQAMSLASAGDPNNPIAKAVRAMYDQQGQAARKQGQQDFGVLSALGAQASQGQFGAGDPMTAGQMGQIYAANQGQAGDAYARAQQRMHDLQQQGIDKGFDQSNQIYKFGQDAQGRYGDTVKNLQGGEQAYYGLQGDFRDELGGYAGDTLGVQSGLNADKLNLGMMSADIAKGNAYAGTGREQGALNQKYGITQQINNNDLAATQANNGSKAKFITSILGAAAGMSDKREKKNISDISDAELDEFLSAANPKTFEYKNDKPGTQPGERIGFMMQDVQGTELGKKMTRRGPGGELMYDKDNLNGILLAGLKREARGKGRAA